MKTRLSGQWVTSEAKRGMSAALPFAAILVLVLCNATFASPRAIVRVRAESIARNDTVTLGDIAVIDANQKTAAGLRGIALGYAPAVGAVREITRQRLLLAISAAGFSSDEVYLEAPAVALVKREVVEVDPAVIKDAVERALLAGLQTEGVTARVSRLDLPARIEVPAGVVSAEASLGGARNLFAPFPVSIELRIDGRVVKRLSTTAQVEAFAPVFVAARDLSARTRIREGDYKIDVRRLDRDSSLYLRDGMRLRGVSLTRPLAKGEAVTSDALAAEFVVMPGDMVRIIGESGALKIILQGEARAAGHIGDRIQVKNVQSGALLQAVVVDEGTVSVRF